ncbi:MAG: hypothetical protein RSB37_07035 [Acetivibrio sp.]
MKKNEMTKRVYQVSKLLSLNLIHYSTLFFLFILYLYESFLFRTVEASYAIFLIFVLPFFVNYLQKTPKFEDSVVLPLFSKKYKFTGKKYLTMNISFLFESLVLFMLQIGNFIVPYERFFFQYIPLFLILGRFLAQLVLTYLLKLYLHHKIINNLI